MLYNSPLTNLPICDYTDAAFILTFYWWLCLPPGHLNFYHIWISSGSHCCVCWGDMLKYFSTVIVMLEAFHRAVPTAYMYPEVMLCRMLPWISFGCILSNFTENFTQRAYKVGLPTFKRFLLMSNVVGISDGLLPQFKRIF